MGLFKWVWYASGVKARRRVTASVQTTQTLADGSRLTTTSTSYTHRQDTVKTTRSYRLLDGSRTDRVQHQNEGQPGPFGCNRHHRWQFCSLLAVDV